MSEAELRESLRAAVADEPPLNFDPDALIARAEAFRRRRRALVAVGVATFALVGTVIALPGVLAPREGFDAARVLTTTAPATVGTASSVPTGDPSAVEAPVTSASSADQAVRYLSGYLTKQVRDLVPGVVDVKVDFGGTGKVVVGHLTGYVFLSDKRGTTSLTVEVISPPASVSRDAFCGPVECTSSKSRPDGSHVEIARPKAADGELFTHMVAHFRDDGTVVVITSHDHEASAAGSIPPNPPVTADQLIALATDPQLTPTG